MKTLYLDCFAGISGDMFVGALLDVGLELADLERELRKLPVSGYRLQVQRVNKRGLSATHFKVMLQSPGGERLADTPDAPPDAHSQAGSHHSHEQDKQAHSHPHDHAHAHPHDDGHNSHDGHSHDQPQRGLNDILRLIGQSTLSESVKHLASRIFTRLGEAEAQVHGIPIDQVHFHEVGGVDAIVDIVSAAIGIELLGIERVLASPLHLGSGFVRISHGLYPIPAPATANLVAGVPVYSTETKGELVTPTGAAIVTTLAESFGPMPTLTISRVGYGAGTREQAFPNVLRAFLGQNTIESASERTAAPAPISQPPQPPPPSITNITSAASSAVNGDASARVPRTPYPEQHLLRQTASGYHEAPATVIEANLDDMNPQLFEALMEQLLSAGALDVILIPVQMKKQRPGALVQILAAPQTVDALLAILFTESTTIGARTYAVTKRMLQRESHTLDTPFGPIRAKVARLGSHIVNVAPEYEDCRALARQHDVPLKLVHAAAMTAASALLFPSVNEA